MSDVPGDPSKAPSPTPLGRRARKAIAVRQSLFAAGLAAFDRQPIGLVSVLDITEAADVAKGVFYLHFKSKDEFLVKLWEDVQLGFLNDVRAASSDCRSRGARLEATVRAFLANARNLPAPTRFWIRMLSFFSDEVGEPGHLRHIRQEYVQQLATILAGAPFDRMEAQDLRVAVIVDAMCWAMIRSSVSTGESICDDPAVVRIVAAAVRSATQRGASRPQAQQG